MVNKHSFSPALKTLFYQGANLNWEPESAGDYALANLALITVELQAVKDGYRSDTGGQDYHLYDIPDPRLGDLLATRLQRDDAYGVQLFHIARLPDEFLKSGDNPLPPDLKVKVLSAWKKQRAGVKNPFTEAQLEMEMARVREIRYDNFQKGPFYEQVVAIVNDAEKTDFANAPMDAINERITALPKTAAPTLFRVFKWRGVFSPPESALQLLADSGDAGAFVQLAQVAYGRYAGDSRVEAIRLMAKLDPKRSQPQIEAFFRRSFEPHDWDVEAPRLGAALVLAERGEKRAVPAFFSAPYDRSLTFLKEKRVVAALHTATGLEFGRLSQWRDWWTTTGSKLNWN